MNIENIHSLHTIPLDCLQPIVTHVESDRSVISLALCCRPLYARIFPMVPQACSQYINRHLNSATGHQHLIDFLDRLPDKYTTPLCLVLKQDIEAAVMEKIHKKFPYIYELVLKNDRMYLLPNVKVLHLPPMSFYPESKDETLQFLETLKIPNSVEVLSLRGGWLSQKTLEHIATCCPKLKRLFLYDCSMENSLLPLTMEFPKSMTELQYTSPGYDHSELAYNIDFTDDCNSRDLIATPNTFRYSCHVNFALNFLEESLPNDPATILQRKQVLEDVLKSNPDDVAALAALGIFLFCGPINCVTRDLPRALQLLERAHSINPEHPLALAGLAVLLSQQEDCKNHEKAKIYYEKACELSLDGVLDGLLKNELKNKNKVLEATSLGILLTKGASEALEVNPKNMFAHIRNITDSLCSLRHEEQDIIVDKTVLLGSLKQACKVNPNIYAVFSHNDWLYIEKTKAQEILRERFYCHPAAFFSKPSIEYRELLERIVDHLREYETGGEDEIIESINNLRIGY